MYGCLLNKMPYLLYIELCLENVYALSFGFIFQLKNYAQMFLFFFYRNSIMSFNIQQIPLRKPEPCTYESPSSSLYSALALLPQIPKNSETPS